ncbi:PREDICTED: ribosome-binding factor PSRP1, chloroplastic-like isoform X2 [Populus euphratica]|uniref:Ribosome-binding factor PSRP1, chloroplastic-like isoform X2 n=1 Tax=Populus euphratica TaxID=75702 RepID=A0AAJ6Y5Y8_POPEU|nr:PREDICTED: ribosome-binding factor PSRP1, chloroplastic-like isoform X2 [Populus euphratica]
MSWDVPPPPFKLIIHEKTLKLTDTVIEHVEYIVGQAIQKHCHLVRAVHVRLCFRGGELGKGPGLEDVRLFTQSTLTCHL